MLALALAALGACLALALAVGRAHGSPLPVVDPTIAADRSVEPVVLTGANFPDWAAPSDLNAKLPLTDLKDCTTFDDKCAHNHYASPDVQINPQDYGYPQGVPTDRLLGFRWDGKHFVQIPFQVDKMFTRYLDNSASGFSVYSGEDQHTTYEFQREGFRYTKSDPSNPCLAQPDSQPAKDPVRGLDTNDELVFMASDAGGQAPSGATLPGGIGGVREVRVDDPLNPGASPKYAYVMKADANGPKPAFDASNGYVSYQRDANANFFEHSESSYSSYGNAASGIVCDASGHVINGPDGKPLIQKRRPRDYATVTTPRYRFRYDGRWLMTAININPSDNGQTISPAGAVFGPNVVDRWKARAFQQDPSSKTPCCGFEEEDTHWGGSSTLLGELVGPVRAIRETWGADSGTNVIRRETFYRDQVRMKSFLRVHVIPPLDGIYAQWDFAAGRMTRYFNSNVPNGVAVDGQNDTVFGNLDDPCNDNYNANQLGQVGNAQVAGTSIPATPLNGFDASQFYRQLYQAAQICSTPYPYHQSINLGDPTFGAANASLQWNEITGPSGTIVDRIQTDKVTDLTAGGLAQSTMAIPYYRDDSCFDDGTGSDPGPRLQPGSRNEPTKAPDGTSRVCWKPQNGIPGPGNDHFFQGDIGTHGLHLLFQAESDNARLTVPVDEIVSEWRMVMLPTANAGNVGETYGREFEKPMQSTVMSYTGTAPSGTDNGGPGGQTGGSGNGPDSSNGLASHTADSNTSGDSNTKAPAYRPSAGVAGFSTGVVSPSNPLGLPSNRRCVKPRKFALRLHQPRGQRLVSVKVFVDGALVRSARGRRVARVVVPKLIQAAQTIKVLARTSRGRLITERRVYRACPTRITVTAHRAAGKGRRGKAKPRKGKRRRGHRARAVAARPA